MKRKKIELDANLFKMQNRIALTGAEAVLKAYKKASGLSAKIVFLNRARCLSSVPI